MGDIFGTGYPAAEQEDDFDKMLTLSEFNLTGFDPEPLLKNEAR